MALADESLDPTLWPLVFGLLGLLSFLAFFVLIPIIRAQIAVYRNKPPDWEHDVTGQDVPTPEQHADVDQHLQSLGLRPLGVWHCKVAYMRSAYEWVYVSESGRIYVEVVFDNLTPVLLQFMTCFPDNAMVITRYPTGENITTPNYISRFARGSIDAALDFHRAQIKDWKAQHGIPNRIETMDDVSRMDEIFRIHHRNRDIQRLFRWNNTSISLNLVSFIVSAFGYVYVNNGGDGLPALATMVVGVSLFILFLRTFMRTPRLVLNPSGAVDDGQYAPKKKKL